MEKSASAPDLSRGVEKNGQEAGLQNEVNLLNCIKNEGWVRENEASCITGMSRYMIGKVSRRLAEKGQIFREQSKNYRFQSKKDKEKKVKEKKDTSKNTKKNTKSKEQFEGNAGYFLRLTAGGAARVGGKSGKDINIPVSWRHDAMAIQTLHFLAAKLDCGFETEASVRHRTQTGKLPDGRLISNYVNYHFEQEKSRKSGANLQRQTEVITKLAAQGTICYVAYPFPASVCEEGIDHETRQTNSLRHRWGSSDTNNIWLVRCHFESLLAYQHMRVSRFEIIALPAMKNTAASQKGQPGVTDQVMGFRWITTDRREIGEPLCIDVVLKYCDEVQFEGTFTAGISDDDIHILEGNNGDIYGKEDATLMSFHEFVLAQQKRMEKNIAGQIAMCALQAKAEAEIEAKAKTEEEDSEETGILE